MARDEKLQSLLLRLATVKLANVNGVSKQCSPMDEERCTKKGKECHVSPKGRIVCRLSAIDTLVQRRIAAKKAYEKRVATKKVLDKISRKRQSAKL